MKIHTKKKAFKVWLKSEALKGNINNADGRIVRRNQIPDNSMRRDYQPTSGKI